MLLLSTTRCRGHLSQVNTPEAATGGTQSKPGTWPFLVLVAGILFFVFWFAREFRPQNATDVKTDTASLPGPEPHLPPSPLRVGQELLLQGKFDEAQLVFESVQTDPSLAAAAWYWRSRVALARGAPAVAVEYVEEALRLDSSASYVAGLKIKAQLLRGGRHRTYARDYADEFAGHETPLGVWVNCVAAAGIFDALVTTAKEMDSKCPLPPFPWHLYEEGHPGAQE